MSEPAKNAALRAGGAMAFALLLSRLLGMLRDTVLVSQFGIGFESDAYQIAMLIPDMIFMLVAGGGLSSAFIPIFSDLWYKEKREEAWKTFGTVVWATTLVSFVLVAIAWAFAVPIVDFFRDKHPAEIVPRATELARIVLPAQVAFLVGSLFLATLYARKSFLGPGLAPNVYNVGIILGGLILPKALGMGIESMAWGALVGAIIGNIVLPLVLMARAGSKLPLAMDLSDPSVKRFFILLLPVLLGFSLPSMATIITQKFASMYGSEGVNTVLRYANNLMQAPLGIFGQSMALAAFPVLSEFVAKGEMDKYRDQVSKTLRTVIFLGMPSAALLAGMAPEITHLLYGYGKAMESPDQLSAIAVCLQIYAVGIFAWCVQPVLMRGFFSMHQTFLPVAIGTVMTLAFIGFCWAVVASGAPYTSIAWATNLAAILLAIGLYFALQRRVGSLDPAGTLKTLGLSTVASAVAGGIAYGLMRLWSPSNRILEAIWVVGIGLVCWWIYYAVGRALKMPESEYLRRAFDRLDRRSRKPVSSG